MRSVQSNARRKGQGQGQDDRTPAQWAELLTHTLDALEQVIRDDLADRRTARNALRCLDLSDGLASIDAAREALAECPEGARLAMLVAGVWLAKVRYNAEDGARTAKGRQKGAGVTNAQLRRRVAASYAALRAKAAIMDLDLSALAKARILAKSDTRSVRQIRRIIKK